MALGCLLHSVHEHASEVLALGCQDSFVSIDWFALDHEDNVSECGIVNYGSHISDQAVDSLIVNFIFFKFADVENANVIEPLAPVEASKDEELLGANDASGMSLAPSWGFLKLERVAPSHRLCVQHIQVVGGNDLLEGATAAIITSKQINLVTDEICCMSSEALRGTSADLRLRPAESLCVKHVKVLQMLVARVASEQVELVPQDCHGVSVPRHRDGSRYLRGYPGHGVEI